MANNKKRIFIDSFTVLFSTVLDKGMFVVINIIVARYLNVDDFGEYTTALSFATFFATFMDIGINNTLRRSINLDPGFDAEHYTSTLVLKAGLALLTYTALAVSLQFANYNSNIIYLAYLFGLVRIGTQYLASYYAFYDAKEKFFVGAMMKNSFSVSFIIATALVALCNLHYHYFVYSRLLVVGFFIALILALMLKDFKPSFNYAKFRGFLNEGRYFAYSSVVVTLYHQINILIVSFISGSRETGFYKNADLFLSSLFFVPLNFSRVILPFMYRKKLSGDTGAFQFAFNVYTKAYTFVSFLLFYAFFVYPEEIIVAIYGDRYAESAPMLRIVAFSILLIFNLSGTVMTGFDKQKLKARIQLSALAVNTGAAVVLVNFFDGAGGAAASLVTYLFLFLSYNIYLYRIKLIRYGKIAAVYLKEIMIVSLLMALHYTVMPDVHFFITLPAEAALFALLNFIFIIDRDDIRIIRETFSGKKAPRGTDGGNAGV